MLSLVCVMNPFSPLIYTLRRPRLRPHISLRPLTRPCFRYSSNMSFFAGRLQPDTLNPATLMSGRFKQEQIPDLSGRVAIVTGGSGMWLGNSSGIRMS